MLDSFVNASLEDKLSCGRWSKQKNGVVFVAESKNKTSILNKIMKRLKKAAEQLQKDKQGVIAIYIPYINSFEGLESEGGLKDVTEVFFNKAIASHIQAVIYVAEDMWVKEGNSYSSYKQALQFDHPRIGEDERISFVGYKKGSA